VIGFWAIAALLVAAAVLFVVPPLVRRTRFAATDVAAQNVALARARLAELDADLHAGRLDKEQFDALRAELEETLATDLAAASSAPAANGQPPSVWPALVVALALPAFAGTIYLLLGNPGAIDAPTAAAMPAGHPGGAPDAATVEQLLERLVARLDKDPDNAEGWYMLGNTYMALKRYPEAAKALARARDLTGGDARVTLRYADALAMSAGGRLAGEPFKIVLGVLEREPANPTALWLAGMGYAESGDDARAVEQWQKLLPLLSGEPDSVNEVRGLINAARTRMGQPPLEPAAAPAPAPETPAASAAQVALTVNVRLDPALASRVRPDDTLFIYARAMSGPPMPLAAVRKRAADLPLSVTLSDAQAMAPGLNLSSVKEVRVGARISRSGNAITQPGDLRGEVAPVSTGAGSVDIVIVDEVR